MRQRLRAAEPGWWNAPVPAWGDPDAWLLIVGLAPGRKGANRTGRPFTGDFAGMLLFEMLAKFGFATGSGNDLRLNGAALCNAVQCLPPANRPSPAEIATCRAFLAQHLASFPKVRVILALGRIAHDSLVRVIGSRPAEHRFAHGAEHQIAAGRMLIDSYHCSRQNQNTGRLTREMFEAVFERALRC